VEIQTSVFQMTSTPLVLINLLYNFSENVGLSKLQFERIVRELLSLVNKDNGFGIHEIYGNLIILVIYINVSIFIISQNGSSIIINKY